jgi:hypothetical protein
MFAHTLPHGLVFVVTRVWALPGPVTHTFRCRFGPKGPTSDLCKGPVTEGDFGECCDSDAQCTTGMVCDPEQRACTFKCTSSANCYASPLYGQASCGPIDQLTCSIADLAYPYLWGTYNQADQVDPPQQLYCDASVGYGWSFSAYCRTCGSGSWSGDAGPDVPYSDDQRVATLLGSLLEDLCSSSPAIQQRCANSTVYTTIEDFIDEVVQTCSESPSGASLCTFGLSVDSLFDSALLLLGLGDWADIAEQLTPEERVAVALNLVISVQPKSTYGVSLSSNEVVMASK